MAPLRPCQPPQCFYCWVRGYLLAFHSPSSEALSGKTELAAFKHLAGLVTLLVRFPLSPGTNAQLFTWLSVVSCHSGECSRKCFSLIIFCEVNTTGKKNVHPTKYFSNLFFLSVLSLWSSTTSLPPSGGGRSTPSMVSCCASLPSSFQWAPVSLWLSRISCCPGRITDGGGGAFSALVPLASSSLRTPFFTTGTDHLWVALYRAQSSLATLCLHQWSSHWCWAAYHSGHL